ncbi:MAG: hypothetical protein K2P43_03645, partial [Lachnospiraceae bacterium]|nr:hypothetical protein [Lachnospiraceae bacterium]
RQGENCPCRDLQMPSVSQDHMEITIPDSRRTPPIPVGMTIPVPILSVLFHNTYNSCPSIFSRYASGDPEIFYSLHSFLHNIPQSCSDSGLLWLQAMTD